MDLGRFDDEAKTKVLMWYKSGFERGWEVAGALNSHFWGEMAV